METLYDSAAGRMGFHKGSSPLAVGDEVTHHHAEGVSNPDFIDKQLSTTKSLVDELVWFWGERVVFIFRLLFERLLEDVYERMRGGEIAVIFCCAGRFFYAMVAWNEDGIHGIHGVGDLFSVGFCSEKLSP